MCGIVGYIGSKNATNILIEGLRKLEYRGYDSAGVAVVHDGIIDLRRSPGKLSFLEGVLQKQPVNGTLGLGHTRWATHGRPSEENAHPHTSCNGKMVVVHNGIIENYIELKKQLSAKGHQFKSQTDTEVLAHLVEENFKGDLGQAVLATLKQIQGSYALGVLAAEDPKHFYAARKDSPLVLGLGEKENFLASDVPALLAHTRRMIFLEDGDVAEITPDGVRVFDVNGKTLPREVKIIHWDPIQAEKGGYRHFMMKEIHEQPNTVRDTFRSRISLEEGRIDLEDVLPMEIVQAMPKICLVACGTSYHAGLVSRFWLEEIAGVSCDVEIASEFRYRRFDKEPGTLIVAITQSGETADTLAALRECKAKGLPTLAICNVVGSSVTRDAAHTLYTHCGPEIGVASTKAFTGQLIALFLLALYIAQSRKKATPDSLRPLLQALSHLPVAIDSVLESRPLIEKIAPKIARKSNYLYLGRHLNYPIALEGALKLKEISYIHAEGYPAGEMKHGPIALIDENLPIVAIATKSFVRDKMLSNIEEVKARGGMVVAVATEGDKEVEKHADFTLFIPDVHEQLVPVLSIIPLQFLAYYVALVRGCDVDQPRNLAKSVTVE